MTTGYATGWFGVPGRPSQGYTKVHIVHDGRPICGVRRRRDAEFQHCASGVHDDIVDCEACKRVLHRIRRNELLRGRP